MIAAKVKTNKTSDRGFSLVEIMITIGVGSIIMMTMVSLLTSQQRETKALSEKLASLDVERMLISSLTDSSICTALLSNPAVNPSAPYTINPANLAANSIPLNSIPSSAAVGAPALINKVQPPSALSSSLKVSSIAVNSFSSTGTPNLYHVKVTVAFDGSTLVRPLKPVVMDKLYVSTDASNKITSCSNGGPVAGCNLADPTSAVSVGCAQCIFAGGTPENDKCILTLCTDPGGCGSRVGMPRELDARTATAANTNANAACVTAGLLPHDHLTVTHSTSCGWGYGLANWIGHWEWHDWGICYLHSVTVIQKIRCIKP